jgi:hypothetical protein
MPHTTADAEQSAKYFIEGFLQRKERPLHFERELTDVIIACFRMGKVEELHDLCFSAKHFRGLIRSVESAGNNSEITDMSALQLEINNAGKDVLGKIEKAGNLLDEEAYARFYAMMAPHEKESAARNVEMFLADLEQLKHYFNDLRRADGSPETSDV